MPASPPSEPKKSKADLEREEFQKRLRGRPSKYDPKFCDELIEHMGKGFSFESFAGRLLVAVSTLYKWAEENPEFSEAKAIGESASLSVWEDDARRGLFHQNFKNGLWVHNMKCRFGKFGWNPKNGAEQEPDSDGFDTGDDDE